MDIDLDIRSLDVDGINSKPSVVAEGLLGAFTRVLENDGLFKHALSDFTHLIQTISTLRYERLGDK